MTTNIEEEWKNFRRILNDSFIVFQNNEDTLLELYFLWTKLENPSGLELVEIFSAIPSVVKSLDLTLNSFGRITSAQFTEIFAAFPTGITSLNLSFDSLGRRTNAEIAEIFAAFPAGVTSLNLGDNELRRKTNAELIEVFQTIPSRVMTLELSIRDLYNHTFDEFMLFFKDIPQSIKCLKMSGKSYSPPICYLLSFDESRLKTLYQDFVIPLERNNNETSIFKSIKPLVPIDEKGLFQLIETFEKYSCPQLDVACALLLDGRIENAVSLDKLSQKNIINSSLVQAIYSLNLTVSMVFEIAYAALTKTDIECYLLLSRTIEYYISPKNEKIFDYGTRRRLFALDFLIRAACNADKHLAITIEEILSHIKAIEPRKSPIFEKLSQISFSQEQGFKESTLGNSRFIVYSKHCPQIDMENLRSLLIGESVNAYGLFYQKQSSLLEDKLAFVNSN